MDRKAPDHIIVARLQVVVLPNGEVICEGRVIGDIKQLGPYLEPEQGVAP